MVQAAAGGKPGKMPEKEQDWGQAETLGDSVSVDGEKDWRSRENGRRAPWRYLRPHAGHVCEHAVYRKQTESWVSHFSFWHSGKFMKVMCLLNSTLSNQNTLSWAQSHKKMYPLLHIWDIWKIMGIIILVWKQHLHCTPGHHGKFSSKPNQEGFCVLPKRKLSSSSCKLLFTRPDPKHKFFKMKLWPNILQMFVHKEGERWKEPLPKNASKNGINLVIDGLSDGCVQIYSCQSPGGVDAVFQANSFQRLVKTLVPSTPLDRETVS